MRESTQRKWTGLIEECVRSGKSAKQWCREKGVCYPLFLQWRKRFGEPSQSSSFIELKEERLIEIRCGGIEIRLSGTNDLKTLKDLLVALC
jgi:hypothetical protein